jgi:hypothetical protein
MESGMKRIDQTFQDWMVYSFVVSFTVCAAPPSDLTGDGDVGAVHVWAD